MFPVSSERRQNTKWSDSPLGSRRRCTDVLFLILIIGTWLAMAGIGLVAVGYIPSDLLKKGQPEVLLNGMDYLGNICGVTNYTNVNNQNVMDNSKVYMLPSGVNLCIETCPEWTDLKTFHCKYEIEAFISDQSRAMESVSGDQAAYNTKQSLYLYYTSTQQCMPLLKTTPFLNFCVPITLTENLTQAIGAEYDLYNITTGSNITLVRDGVSGNSFFNYAMADMYTVRYVIIVCGIGGALFLGFLYLTLLRIPGVLVFMVWTVVVIITCILTLGGYYMRETSIRWANEGIKEDREVEGVYWLSILSFAFAMGWFLIVCAMRKRISLAIAVVKEASAAISAMPILVLYPFLPIVGFILFLLPWVLIMIFLASSGEVVPECMCSPETIINTQTSSGIEDILNSADINILQEEECGDGCFLYRSFQYAQNTQYAGYFLLFTLFWTTQFITACMQLCIATSISMWYFTKDKTSVGNHTFFRALNTTTIYHLGTCAFGSLILATVNTIRIILIYIQKKISKMQSSLANAVFMSLQCCLCLLERFIKFVSKNAYIQTAIHGHPFCKGSREAFDLLLRNILRISAVSVVAEIILIAGKLLIIAASTIAAYFYLEAYYEDKLRGLYTVTSLVFLVALISAELFNQIFSIAISTIIQCFVTDQETFEPDDMFAHKDLMNVIDETQKSVSMSTAIYPNKKEMLDGETT